MSTTITKNGTSQASLQNHLGLKNADMEKLSVSLNALLSDYHIFYQNVRGFHWNVKGTDFFSLHIKFEELYTMLSENIDELAERIITIGYRPLHSYSDFQEHASHMEIKNVSDGKQCVKHIQEGLGMLISRMRSIAREASDSDDVSTSDLLTRYTGALEKQLWMFTMYLTN